MRAIVIPEMGDPDVLRLVDLDEPQPGTGQVSIQVAYVGVNYVDILARKRGYRVDRYPFVPGMEVSGHIRALGEGVEGFHVGQPVAAMITNGGYAEVAIASADLTVPLDGAHGQLDLAAAAASQVVMATAYDLLVNLARVRAGETVLIHAASGGVGNAACQLAHALGAGTVVGTVGSERKIAAAKANGFDQVVLREGFVDAVRALIKGRGVDVILDAAGEPTRSQSLSLLAPFGRLVIFGSASGAPDAPIAPGALIAGTKGVLGYSLSSLIHSDPKHVAANLREAFELIRTERARIVISDTLPLEQAALAHQRFEQGANTGKLLLRIEP